LPAPLSTLKSLIRKWTATPERRGVASVLAMMFLILFGSLAAAMAIASKGNIKTAATHLHVSRAMSAAETGLAVARVRLAEAASRFVVSHSQVDSTFASDMWTGDTSGYGTVTLIAPPSGYEEASNPAGIAQALANHHAADQNTITGVTVDAPTIGRAPADADTTIYSGDGWVFTPAVKLETGSGRYNATLGYSIRYAPLQNGTDVRAIVTGYDFDDTRGGTPITRTIMQDFRISKRVDSAIVSPSRILIGKNVQITGDLGVRYTQVTENNGDPLTIRSDFFGLNATLDAKLTDLFNALKTADVDGDNRLRINNPTEAAGIPSATKDYNSDGTADNAFADVTGDGYVDEFDVFIKHFDANSDGKVTLPTSLTAGTPAQGRNPEFTLDDDLVLLIDSAVPDRNKNGIYGWVDTNGNGRWDSGEAMNDYDNVAYANRDQVLGWRDGYVDKKDQYAKVRGRLVFKTTDTAWRTAQGDYSAKLRGPVKPAAGKPPRTFGAGDDQLPNITSDNFVDSEAALRTAADGGSFSTQVASNLGVAANTLPTYVETKASGTKRYFRVDPDANLDGRPDNYATAYFEKMPFNSPNYSDWYYRPVYENMVFKDVKIPMGTNALFRQLHLRRRHLRRDRLGEQPCPLRRVRQAQAQHHRQQARASDRPHRLRRQRRRDQLPRHASLDRHPARRHDPHGHHALDKADIPANQVSTTQGYNNLPDPLIINGKRIVDTKAISNNIRFHDCLFVGSIVSDKPGTYTQVRNKLQFTGSTRFTDKHPEYPDNSSLNPDSTDVAEIAKSSMMLPNYSVDIGTFNSPTNQNVQLKGAIIAGVLTSAATPPSTASCCSPTPPSRDRAPSATRWATPSATPPTSTPASATSAPATATPSRSTPQPSPPSAGSRSSGMTSTATVWRTWDPPRPPPPPSWPLARPPFPSTATAGSASTSTPTWSFPTASRFL
jgi:Tfp pilus assembly protein PilX